METRLWSGGPQALARAKLGRHPHQSPRRPPRAAPRRPVRTARSSGRAGESVHRGARHGAPAHRAHTAGLAGSPLRGARGARAPGARPLTRMVAAACRQQQPATRAATADARRSLGAHVSHRCPRPPPRANCASQPRRAYGTVPMSVLALRNLRLMRTLHVETPSDGSTSGTRCKS